MTESEFLALPDREKDALVAEKVFGWHVDRFTWEYDGHFKDCMVWITDPSRKDEPAKDRLDVTKNPIPYSTSVAAAWEVVEKIVSEQDEDERFEITPWVDECSIAVTYFGERSGEELLIGPIYTLAKTAPLAICLAALRAKGVLE